MALITRVSRLFRADLHAVIDRLEEPDVLLKQAVREMQDDIGKDEQRAKQLEQEQALLNTRTSELDNALEQLDEKLDTCFESGKEELARTLLKRKLESQRLIQVLIKKREQLVATQAELASRLRDNRSRLAAMQQKAELLIEQHGSTSGAGLDADVDISVRDEDVEVAFLKEKQKRSQS